MQKIYPKIKRKKKSKKRVLRIYKLSAQITIGFVYSHKIKTFNKGPKFYF